MCTMLLASLCTKLNEQLLKFRIRVYQTVNLINNVPYFHQILIHMLSEYLQSPIRNTPPKCQFLKQIAQLLLHHLQGRLLHS